MFKCPYCGSIKTSDGARFKDWRNIQFHTSHCKLSNNEYFVDSVVGPIHYKEFCNITDKELRQKYPNLKRNINKIRKKFEKFGIQIDANLGIFWTKERCIEAIKEFVILYNKIPTARDFTNNPKFPSYKTVEERFGSWNAGLKASKFPTYDINLFGTPSIAKDSCYYRSKLEAYFVDNYLYGKYSYEYELPYGNGWYYDFYIKELDLYIEIDGGLRPQRILEKIEFNKQLNRKFIVINQKEISNVNLHN